MLVPKCLLETPLFLYPRSYLVQDNPEHPFVTSDLLRRACNRVVGLVLRVQIYSSVVRVGHFLPFCIHDDSSTALVFWNTVPACTKIKDLLIEGQL